MKRKTSVPRTKCLNDKNCFLLYHFLAHEIRYFYGPIDGTPFTLGIALPDKYGMLELNSQEEIRHSHQNGKY